MPISRRRFLHTASFTGTLLALQPVISNNLLAASAGSALQWQDLGDGLAVVNGAGAAVLVISGKDGVALVDGGAAVASGELLALVKARTKGVPRLLFNTHCHRDQIGCNQTLGAQGATIIAHENTRLWLTTEIISKWEHQVYPPLPAKAWPNKTFYYDTQSLTFNHPLNYDHLPQAHTDGDIYVHLPEQNLIFVGDAVSVGSYPILDYATNGWIGGLITSLNQLLPLCDNNTRVIASGGSVNKAHIEQQLDMCNVFAERIGTHYYKGGSLAEFIDSKPTAEFDAAWGDPSLFIATAWEGTLPHVTEIRRFGRRTRA